MLFMRVKDINMPPVQVTHLNRFETYLSQIPIIVVKFVALTIQMIVITGPSINNKVPSFSAPKKGQMTFWNFDGF